MRGVPAKLAGLLQFMDARPQIRGFESTDLELAWQQLHGFYRLHFPNGFVSEGTPANILAHLHLFHSNQTRREFPQAALLHAASL